MCAVESPLLFEACALLMDRWNAEDAVKLMDGEGCTHIIGATPFLDQLLAASRQVPPEALGDHAAVGELGLDGRLRPVGGVLAAAEGARSGGLTKLLCAAECAAEAALAGIDTYAYLIKLLERLAAGWPQRRIDELLPENHVPVVAPAEAPVAEPQPLA